MSMVISLKFVINHWRLFAMQDGYTLYSTVIYAQSVLGGGYLHAFIGKEGTRIIVRMNAPLPTELAARNALRDVLWGAHVDQRINLHADPKRPTRELAA